MCRYFVFKQKTAYEMRISDWSADVCSSDRKIDKAIWQAREVKGYPQALVWARPQVCRDGWVYNHDDWPTYAASQVPTSYPLFPNLIQLGRSDERSVGKERVST